MNILSISKTKSEAVISLNSTELVSLCNVLYEETKGDCSNSIIFLLYGNLMMARDLSQYGLIDGFCFEKIAECREKAKELKSIKE